MNIRRNTCTLLPTNMKYEDKYFRQPFQLCAFNKFNLFMFDPSVGQNTDNTGILCG